VKAALRNALEQLSPHDRFSLVAFAGHAQVLISHQSGADKRRLLEAIEQLEGLQLGDDTYMAQGMALGYQEATKAQAREPVASVAWLMVNRMIILTDGFTLDPADCLRQAQQATARGLSVSTMGLGVEFNEELMIKMADMSGGNAYFIHDPQDIPQVFAQELSGAQAIALRNLELKLRLANGVELRRAHRVKPIISDSLKATCLGRVPIVDRSLSLPLGDLEHGSVHSILVELIAPPRPAGTYRLAHTVLSYDSPAQGLLSGKVRSDIVVQYVDDPQAGTHTNAAVMNVVEKVSAHRLQTRALEDVQAGNVAGATVKLRAAATRLLNMGEDELAQAALQEAENLERQGQLSPAGTKKLRYETRRLTQKPEG
jgi:Ca-activated chloride channel family protein